MKQGLTLQDVSLTPQFSSISSRFSGDISLETQLGPNFILKYPIISANMDSVTGPEMCREMRRLGGLGIPHRYIKIKNLTQWFTDIGEPFTLCIGCHKEDIDRIELYQNFFNLLPPVLIDIAHGHSQNMLDQIQRIRGLWPNIFIIAGNVATYEGCKCLLESGANCVKCGIADGSVCLTRSMTGNYVPQFTAIQDTVRARNIFQQKTGKYRTIIADGGIKTPGDVLKAIAAGADAVMLGSYFAGTKEACGYVIERNGQQFKAYRGMASQEAREDFEEKRVNSSFEGTTIEIPYKGLVAQVFSNLVNGILSGMSYQDARNIKELQENAEFISLK